MPEISPSKYQHWHRPDRLKGCVTCGEKKPLSEFYAYGYTNRLGNPGTRYESRCKPCSRKRRKDQTLANPGRNAEISKRRRERVPEWYTAYQRERQKQPEVRALKAYHQRLRKARMRSGAGDNEAIRAIYAEAMEIERIVACCPVFDIPEIGKKMHVDHIIPLSRGGLHVVDNLQILPIGLNMRKGVKCPR